MSSPVFRPYRESGVAASRCPLSMVTGEGGRLTRVASPCPVLDRFREDVLRSRQPLPFRWTAVAMLLRAGCCAHGYDVVTYGCVQAGLSAPSGFCLGKGGLEGQPRVFGTS